MRRVRAGVPTGPGAVSLFSPSVSFLHVLFLPPAPFLPRFPHLPGHAPYPPPSLPLSIFRPPSIRSLFPGPSAPPRRLT